MKKIGITGGIGSGKTTVCKIFETLGIPVYYADERAKQLMVSDPVLQKRIVDLFGKQAYLPSGQLNRAHIASIVFNDKAKLSQLNAAVHPAVAADGIAWHEQQHAPYTLKEAALLFESGSAQQLDAVISVYAPEQIRIQRVMQRDGQDEKDIRDRMRNQWPEWKKLIAADAVLLNYGDYALIPQIMALHERWR